MVDKKPNKKIKIPGYTIAFDFIKTKKFGYESADNCSTLYLYYFNIWFIKGSLLEFLKRLKDKFFSPSKDDKHLLN